MPRRARANAGSSRRAAARGRRRGYDLVRLARSAYLPYVRRRSAARPIQRAFRGHNSRYRAITPMDRVRGIRWSM